MRKTVVVSQSKLKMSSESSVASEEKELTRNESSILNDS